MVFSTLCRQPGIRHPMICTSGQLREASWQLLDLLAASGCSLYYAGDFDPEGLAIADRLWQTYGDRFHLWHMTLQDYQMDLLAASGCSLYYAGDFDPEGLAIADRLWQTYGDRFHLWHMTLQDYQIALSTKPVSSSSRLNQLEKVQCPFLQPVAQAILHRHWWNATGSIWYSPGKICSANVHGFVMLFRIALAQKTELGPCFIPNPKNSADFAHTVLYQF